MRHASRSATLKTIAAATLLVGVALRILGAWWYRNAPNPDYAIVVEMARNMARGNGWPVFFYGQAYMGSLEPAASALLVRLFGPSSFVVCLGTALFGALLLLAVRRWASDAAGPWAGVLAMAAAAIGPPAYFQYMGSPRGGYALGLLLIVVILREGCRIAAREAEAEFRGRPQTSPLRYVRLGLLAGLAFWNFWLVLPAVATTGLLLISVLRQRVLRRRVILPGIAGFFVGSAPFWVYNAAHAWASFAPANGGSPGLHDIPDTLRLLFLDRLPRLFGLSLPSPWQTLLAASLVAVAVVGIALLFPRWGRLHEPRSWMLPAMAVFGSFFGAAYTLSSFGRVNTPRYILPLVPILAVLSGVVPVLLVRRARAIRAAGVRRAATIAAAAASAFLVAAPLAGEVLSLRHHRAYDRKGEAWKNRLAVATDTLLREGVRIAVVDYTLWGANWVADERIVFSTPHLERYRPYALAQEASEDNPAVIENYRGFSHFLDATRGRADALSIPHLRVAVRATPPEQAAAVLPAQAIGDILNDEGNTVRTAVTDQFRSSMTALAVLPDRPRHIDVRLSAHTAVCGVRLWLSGSVKRGLFSVEAVRPDGTSTPLTPACVDSGFHWSGPRFFWGGAEHHLDLRFDPVETDLLRVRIAAQGGGFHAMVNQLDVLAPADPAPPADPAAIATELAARGARRVHAGRWLAARLRPLLSADVWVSPLPDPDVPASAADAIAIVPDEGTVLVVDSGDVEPVRSGLAMMDASADEVRLGGATAFFLRRPPNEKIAAYRGAMFLGCTVQHGLSSELASVRGEQPASPPALLARFEDGAFGIVAVRRSSETVHPGDEIKLEIEWFFADGETAPSLVFQGLHFIQDGKIVFQCDEPFAVEIGGVDETGRPRFVTRFSVPVPDGVIGSIVPAFCLYRPGLRSQRLAPDTALPVSRNRILLDPVAVER